MNWDEREQDKLLALKLFEDTRLCPMCGGPIEVCTNPENEHAYQVPPPTRCHKTTAIMKAMGDDWDKRPHNGALMLGAQLDHR